MIVICFDLLLETSSIEEMLQEGRNLPLRLRFSIQRTKTKTGRRIYVIQLDFLTTKRLIAVACELEDEARMFFRQVYFEKCDPVGEHVTEPLGPSESFRNEIPNFL